MKSILKEANDDGNLVINIERPLARISGRNEYRRPLQFFTKSREDRDLVERIIARYSQQYLPLMTYIREDLLPHQLQLDNHVRDSVQRETWLRCTGFRNY